MGTRLRNDLDNYWALDRFLAGKDQRVAGNNTVVRRVYRERIDVILHSTPVVTHCQDGRIILRTGGWHTVTTKDRINRHTPGNVRVDQHNWDWSVRVNGETIPFEEGMTIHP